MTDNSSSEQSTGALPRLIAGYRELSRMDAAPTPNYRGWNPLYDQMEDDLRAVITDPLLLAALAVVGESDPDPFVRLCAQGATDPPPSGADGVSKWLAHPAVGLAALVGAVRYARVLNEQWADGSPDAIRASLEEAAQYDTHSDSSWLGGPPLGPLTTWPRRADGIALVHVAQIDLRPGRRIDGYAAEAMGSAALPNTGLLPDTGVLQVFHDLETTGYYRGDDSESAWLVRWVQTPAELVTPPPDAHGPTPAYTRVEQVVGATLPCPEDLEDHDAAARCEIAKRKLIAAQLPVGVPGPPPILWHLRPLSTLLGYGWESEHGALQVLGEATQDHGPWLLLADLSGTGALDQWFADEGHLELWIRPADLAERAFDRVWALLRYG